MVINGLQEFLKESVRHRVSSCQMFCLIVFSVKCLIKNNKKGLCENVH